MVVFLTACATVTFQEPESPDLTESYGCGYGFAVGNEAQTVGLVLTFNDFQAASQGTVNTSYDLPDPAWSAVVNFGSDLFSNWCDDVMEPGEPEVVINDTAQVSGVLTIESLPDPGTCGPATATLGGASYETGDGEVVELGDLDLSNDGWGCFAG